MTDLIPTPCPGLPGRGRLFRIAEERCRLARDA